MAHRLSPQAQADVDNLYRVEGDDAVILRVIGGPMDIESILRNDP